jgi:hypothetical protein
MPLWADNSLINYLSMSLFVNQQLFSCLCTNVHAVFNFVPPLDIQNLYFGKQYEIRNTLLKKAQSLNIKVDKDYEIVHERRMT